MTHEEMDGRLFVHVVKAGAEHLLRKVEHVDALNVFPVPDGDTGTNMNLTLSTGVDEMRRSPTAHIGEMAGMLSRGLLLGARGNSGVILSQLFRGFAAEIKDKETVTSRDFAKALQNGVDTAYKAVIKPVEGTVLTVARKAASHATDIARKETELATFMEEVVSAAKKALDETPELLPILKQTGVVDAGGQGLVYIYEGFWAALSGERIPESSEDTVPLASLTELAHQQSAQAHIDTGEIAFGYCTEFIVQLTPEGRNSQPFDEASFRNALSERGDSLLVVTDDDLVKVHIHTEEPLKLIEYGSSFGDIRTAKIENMREQHRAIVEKDKDDASALQAYGTVVVAQGDGMAEIFRSLGADEVIQGGQTMNPSTEDIAKALRKIPAEQYIVLPNNSNVVMAAEQAGEMIGRPVTVIPSKTIPQGLSAILAFNREAGAGENKEMMLDAIRNVISGEVTHAVRDSHIGPFHIKEGDYLGIADGEIQASAPTLASTVEQLLQKMVVPDAEIVTVFYGRDTEEAQAEALERYITEQFPDVEVEMHYGGQPLYYYLIAVE